MNRVLVTGSTGLVGRAVSRRLKAVGLDVVEIARTLPEGDHVIAMDLSCQPLVGHFDERIDGIVHLAASVPVPGRVPDSEESAWMTKRIDENVLELARHLKVPVVYASACSLYNKRTNSLKRERCELIATSPYLAAKLRGESIFRSSLADTAVIRISSPFDIGLGKHLVLAKFVEAAYRNATLEVWGTGSREQDFLHAEDIGDFIIRLLGDFRGGVWNVAAGKALKMAELADLVIGTVGMGRVRRVTLTEDPREGEAARYSIAAARTDFDWDPIRKLTDWIKAYRPIQQDSP